jgi:hypothetical protein
VISKLCAIDRLKNRDRWLLNRIEEIQAEDATRPTYFLERDRESIAIAVAAIEYVIAVEQYEASQSPQSE